MILKFFVGITAVAAGLISAALLALFQGGIATVYVKDADTSIFLPVPMGLADVALAFVPEEELAEVRRELGPHRELVRVALQELANCPDAVLVDFQSHDESVLIRKEGDKLIVKVHSPSEEVEVTVPLRAVTRLTAALAG